MPYIDMSQLNFLVYSYSIEIQMMICQDRLGTLMMSVLRDDECLKSLAERIRNQTCRFVLCCVVLFCVLQGKRPRALDTHSVLSR
jgi:DMSO reductase anchor subunit